LLFESKTFIHQNQMKTCEKDPILLDIGNHLRKLRILNNKTTKEIACVLNITSQAYGNIERGETDICVTKLISLTFYYKITITELFPEQFRSFCA
jgi:transcriptional regulator with XRE-family HTH domain